MKIKLELGILEGYQELKDVEMKDLKQKFIVHQTVPGNDDFVDLVFNLSGKTEAGENNTPIPVYEFIGIKEEKE